MYLDHILRVYSVVKHCTMHFTMKVRSLTLCEVSVVIRILMKIYLFIYYSYGSILGRTLLIAFVHTLIIVAPCCLEFLTILSFVSRQLLSHGDLKGITSGS